MKLYALLGIEQGWGRSVAVKTEVILAEGCGGKTRVLTLLITPIFYPNLVWIRV